LRKCAHRTQKPRSLISDSVEVRQLGLVHRVLIGGRLGRRGMLVDEMSMTSHPARSSSIAEVCESVKRLGYGASQNIRLYGEEFEVVSDPLS